MAHVATLKHPKPQIPTATIAAGPALPRTRAFAMLSHRGRVRQANQDACAALPQLGAFVVCDGIGGAAGGEIASHLASEAFLEALSQPAHHARRIPPKSASSPASDPASLRNGASSYPAGHPHSRLHEAVRAANQAVHRHSRKSPSLHGMGTTLVAALLDDAICYTDHAAHLDDDASPSNGAASAPTLWLANVGDSRCYRLRHATLQLLTQDHSLVEEQVRAGILNRTQARRSPIRNIITRAIGSQPSVEPDIAAHVTQPGDLYLLTSDGLTRELTDPEIAQLIQTTLHTASPTAPALESACQVLIDAANAHGGRDNITVLLIACP